MSSAPDTGTDPGVPSTDEGSRAATADGDGGGRRGGRRGGRHRGKIAAVAGSVVVLVLAVAVGIAISMHKTVTVVDDGRAQEVGTMAGTVQGALDDAQLTVGDHDTVAPGLDARIDDGMQIVIERGRLLTLTIDGQTRQVWTTAATLETGPGSSWVRTRRVTGSPPTAPGRSRSAGLSVSADTLRTAP